MKLHKLLLLLAALVLPARAAEIANSQTEFTGTHGSNGWYHGWRNYTDTGATNNYDASAHFTQWAGDSSSGAWVAGTQQWATSAWDMNTAGAAPWTFLGPLVAHPNGTNQTGTFNGQPNNKEHWTIRRWQADELSGVTPVAVTYTHRKQGTGGNGTTVYLARNGTVVTSTTMNSTTALTRTYYFNLSPGDKVDLCLGPLGLTDRTDGSDGSEYAFTVNDTIPPLPVQPDGTFFIAANAPDTDGDGLADAWENFYIEPDNLATLDAAGDFDSDGSTNLQEQSRSTSPVDSDSDDDGLSDGVETGTGTFVSASDTGTNPRVADTDGDTIRDGLEVTGNGRGAPPTNPTLADTDGDTFRDADEIFFRSNPISSSDTPLTFAVANSATEFSGVQGQSGWNYGFRNYTDDGGGDDYDHITRFVAFSGGSATLGTTPWNATNINNNSQHWSGSQWDLSVSSAPWTTLGAEAIHPNGTNSTTTAHPQWSAKEQWIIRRWSGVTDAGTTITAPTPVALIYNSRRTAVGAGTTSAIYINGVRKDFVVMPGTNGFSTTRKFYTVLNPTDVVDLVLTPVGPTGDRADSSDGSAHWLRVDTRIPFDAFQPDGSFFVPPGAPDTDNDGLADAWEDYWFEANLAALSGAGDYDSDGRTDGEEFTAGTFPNDADTDDDGLNDGGEATAGSNPRLADTDGDGRTDGQEVNGTVTSNPTLADTDGDGFNDGNEVFLNSSPTDNADTPLSQAVADSQTEFSGVQGTLGWNYGYRNFTADGGAASYDAVANFIPFAGGSDIVDPWNGTTQQWNAATGWDLNTAGAAPWTLLGSAGGNQDTHPNGTNQAAPNNQEHWTIRRWTCDLTDPTPVGLVWHTRKQGAGGAGVTGGVYVNGVLKDAVAIAGTDTTGVTRRYFINLFPGDKVDLVHTPVGPTGDRLDGADGSFHWLRVDKRIPANPTQPDGSPFVPIVPAPFVARFTGITATDMTVAWASYPGQVFDLEISSDLDPDNWLQLQDNIAADAGAETQVTVPIPPPFAQGRIFVRVLRR